MTTKRPKVRKAVFPIGGLGTRFLPVTKALPKEMLPVIDRPLIQFVVEEALKAGIEELIFVTGRGKEAIENHFDIAFELERTLRDRGKFEILEDVKACSLEPGCASYIRQQEPKGLGHAVWCARHLVGEEPFAVLLADDLILGGQASAMAELLEVYAERGGQIVSVMDVPLAHVSRYGILAHEERKGATCVIKKIIEKPQPEEAPSQTAVIGRYILSPQIFAFLEQQNKAVSGEIQLTDALAMTLKEGGSFTGVYLSGRRFDCGSREGMVCATLFRALQDPTLAPLVQREIEEGREEERRKTS